MLFGRHLEKTETEKVLLIIVSSDRGLAGAFNANVIKFAEARIREMYGHHLRTKRLSLITVGRRSTDYFSKRNYDIIEKHVGVYTKIDFSTAKAIAEKATALFADAEYDKIELIYNEFKSVIAQRQTADRLLPVLDRNNLDRTKKQHTFEYIYEPEPAEILNVLVPRQLETQVWKSLLESNAAEQGARMTAMDSAAKNARELIGKFQLFYNKARQAAITKEILEIVGGAEALTKG